jgi:hypothetical protein
VVPFNYLSLVWAMILGFAVWRDVPTPGLLVGSAIVVASGLYIPVARDLAPPPPGGPSAATDVVPPSGLRKALRIQSEQAAERRFRAFPPLPRKGEV